MLHLLTPISPVAPANAPVVSKDERRRRISDCMNCDLDIAKEYEKWVKAKRDETYDPPDRGTWKEYHHEKVFEFIPPQVHDREEREEKDGELERLFLELFKKRVRRVAGSSNLLRLHHVYEPKTPKEGPPKRVIA